MAFLYSTPPGFREHPLVRGPHAQTMFPYFWPADGCPGSGQLHRVAVDEGDRIVLHEDRPADGVGRRIVLLIHGLGGSHASTYVSRMAMKLTSRGFHVFRMDMRGCGAGLHLAKGVFHADRSDDLFAAVDWISRQYKHSPVTLVGYSLGANLTLKLLTRADCSLPPQIDSALAVAPPIDLGRCCRLLSRGLGKIYDEFFARALWRDFQNRRAEIRGADQLEVRRRPRTLLEFDTAVTAPLAGYRSVTEYYDNSSAGKDFSRVNVATAILTSQDDPIVPPVVYRDCHLPENVQLFATESGGHLGYLGHAVDGNGRRSVATDRRWMDWRLIDWIIERDLAARS